VVALLLPPLRAREGDVELLAETFITRLAAQYGLPPALLDLETRSRLRAHPWPGNVRELRNVIERALVLSTPGRLELEDLGASRVIPESGGELPFPAPLRTITQAAVERMLRLAHGNKSEAARRLGISRPRLQRIIDGLGEDE
jgi:DNA-binding NtrC family response regulator